MDELSGKVAVVTGGASGIGLALAHAFAAEGMKVVLADIEVDALDKAAAELPEGTEVEAVVCDVSDAAQVDALRDRTVERFGTAHVVCNNAGVSSAGPIWLNTLEDWDWCLGVNLYGVINGVRAFTPLLIEQGEGHIVNTASMAGLTSAPGMGVYNVSKHGVVTLSETLHADLALAGATGVGVSVLCPGWVDTRIHESHRNRAGREEREPTEQERGMLEVVGALLAAGLDPADVAAQVLAAVQERRFYVLTHPDWKPMVTNRVERIVAGEEPMIAGLPA
ncbi:SDR family NAD(P)-dependent oxidoreductase [Aquihabitans sp. G128]|uniref:SDR family NAD(P)-dependent oxidoreductase n=1 Tax=Aquihabitans sp. G128 TaxID=2849779 RepID=UPI001C21FFAF|nr:SDR family NAD(P)-dependent oxidoreductase [Aquihabitans sp. G128]QXC62798.1 SDR family NAD(P)-dependent oxidoreductase [Aquihabitans sp. G128]